jgi:hypothetical protein
MSILITFLLTTAAYGCLTVLGLKSLVRQFQARPDKLKTITNHLLIPLFGVQPVPGEGQMEKRE